MKKFIALALASGAFSLASYAAEYQAVADWLHLPRDLEQMGNQHGDVAVSSAGDVYVSVLGGAKAGVQVYNDKGKSLGNVKDAPGDYHGFVIHKSKDGDRFMARQWGAGRFTS